MTVIVQEVSSLRQPGQVGSAESNKPVRVAHTKSLLRKSPTCSVVEGPPMFMNTIAVGPFDPVKFCVTGGATDAMPAFCSPCPLQTATAGLERLPGKTFR